MRLAVLGLIAGLAACTDGLDEGTSYRCDGTCGPGALTAGRFVGEKWAGDRMASNASGQLVRGHDNTLGLVDQDLHVTATLALDGQYGDLDVREVAIAPDGGAVTVAGWQDDFAYENQLVAVDAHGHETWRQVIGDGDGPDSIAIGDDLVFVGAGNGYQHVLLDGQSFAGSYLVALDRATGAFAWKVDTAMLASRSMTVVALADGGCAYAAWLKDDDGTDGSGVVVSIDRAGAVRWTRQADASGDHPFVRIERLSAAPTGELAFPLWWAGDDMTLSGRTLPSDLNGQFPIGYGLALLSPAGDLKWLRSLRGGDGVSSIATDGTAVLLGGSYTGSGVSFDPHPTDATHDVDGYAGLLTSETGPAAWVTPAHGVDSQRITALALLADRAVVEVESFGGEDDITATLSFSGVEQKGNGFLYGTLSR